MLHKPPGEASKGYVDKKSMRNHIVAKLSKTDTLQQEFMVKHNALYASATALRRRRRKLKVNIERRKLGSRTSIPGKPIGKPHSENSPDSEEPNSIQAKENMLLT